jgi:hypothetical protein
MSLNALAEAAAGSIACQDIESSSKNVVLLSEPCKDEVSAKWSSQLTTEERHFITDKIKTAYLRKTPSYDELLDICCAIEEEHVFLVAPSRLDYFKSGVQYEKRIVEKIASRRRCHLTKNTEEKYQKYHHLDIIQIEDSKNVKRAKILH